MVGVSAVIASALLKMLAVAIRGVTGAGEVEIIVAGWLAAATAVAAAI